MKCSFGISNLLEEIPSLSHSVVFLYFFALITEEGFLSLLTILWNSAFRCFYLSFSSLLFTSLLFTAICKAFSDSHFAFLLFFSMGMVLIPVSCTVSQTSVHRRENIRGQTHCNHTHRKLVNLITWTTALSNSMKLSHAVWGHPRREGHGGEV